jgi:hypothetical protein
MPARKAAPSRYQLKITLAGIAPPIWRRFQAPTNIRLCCLHDAIQTIMGWTDSHLHEFIKDDRSFGMPDPDGELDIEDEYPVLLNHFLSEDGDSAIYRYDFGDSWVHELLLEKILPPDEAGAKPVCLEGERRCPPEDVGGPHGYADFLEIMFDPTHPDFERLRLWAGGPFQAEEFDAGKVNASLAKMRWPRPHRRTAY